MWKVWKKIDSDEWVARWPQRIAYALFAVLVIITLALAFSGSR